MMPLFQRGYDINTDSMLTIISMVITTTLLEIDYIRQYKYSTGLIGAARAYDTPCMCLISSIASVTTCLVVSDATCLQTLQSATSNLFRYAMILLIECNNSL